MFSVENFESSRQDTESICSSSYGGNSPVSTSDPRDFAEVDFPMDNDDHRQIILSKDNELKTRKIFELQREVERMAKKLQSSRSEEKPLESGIEEKNIKENKRLWDLIQQLDDENVKRGKKIEAMEKELHGNRVELERLRIVEHKARKLLSNEELEELCDPYAQSWKEKLQADLIAAAKASQASFEKRSSSNSGGKVINRRQPGKQQATERKAMSWAARRMASSERRNSAPSLRSSKAARKVESSQTPQARKSSTSPTSASSDSSSTQGRGRFSRCSSRSNSPKDQPASSKPRNVTRLKIPQAKRTSSWDPAKLKNRFSGLCCEKSRARVPSSNPWTGSSIEAARRPLTIVVDDRN